MSHVVQHDDQPPLGIVKNVGWPWATCPPSWAFQFQMLFKMMVLAWFGIHNIHVGWNPMLMNKNVLWSFIPTPLISWHFLAEVMDLNYIIWVVSPSLVEHWQLFISHPPNHPCFPFFMISCISSWVRYIHVGGQHDYGVTFDDPKWAKNSC